jgi:hypothetical protein
MDGASKNPQAAITSPEQQPGATQATATHAESVPVDPCNSTISKLHHQADDDDFFHSTTQQPFRFRDLPRELRDMIYSFALYRNTKIQPGQYTKEPDLLAGSSNSATARALSQVCRTIRQESMETYYSKTTFVVRGVPDPWDNMDPIYGNNYPDRLRTRPGFPSPSDALNLWAETWGVLGAQHIRSLRIAPLGYNLQGGLIQIPRTDGANPISFAVEPNRRFDFGARLNAAGKVFRTPVEGALAANRMKWFLREVGKVLRAYNEWSRIQADKAPRRNQRHRVKKK